MRRQRLVPTCCLVALCLLGAAAVATPVAADGTATTASDVRTAAQSSTNQTYNDTVFLDAARGDDGTLYLAGTAGNVGSGATNRTANATVTKQSADGATLWTRTVESSNVTAFVAARAAPAGGVYLVQTTTDSSSDEYTPPEASLLRVDSNGVTRWRTSIPTQSVGTEAPLTVTDDGVVVANRTRDGLELLRYGPDGDREWRGFYDVEAGSVSLTETEAGLLVAGTVGSDSPWLMRLDEDGRVQSNETYPSTSVGRVRGAVPTPDGGTVVVGTAGGFSSSAQVALGVGPDGAIHWTRVTGSQAGQVTDVLETDDGLLLVGGGSFASAEQPSVTLTDIGYDGAVRSRTRLPGVAAATVVPGPDDRLTVVGLSGAARERLRTTVRTIPRPTPDPDADSSLDANAQVGSGQTHYRGQNVQISSPGRAGETVQLVALPDEYDDFEPHVAREVTLDRNGDAVVETATLRSGRYVFETDDGAVFVESGSVVNPSTREAASFELTEHDIYSHPSRRGTGSEGQYVDPAAGETTATLAWDSRRDDYVAHVSFDRFRGDRVNESTLDAVFGDVPGYRGTTTVDDTPVARIESGGETSVSVPVTPLEPGLYDVTIRGADTGDVGDAAETRLVVGTTESRPLSVSLGDEPVRVSVGNETTRNVTLSGVTNGVAAMAMAANRTGQPGVRPGLRVEINGTRSSASAGFGGDRATAAATSIGGDTTNGTVDVGQFSVEARPGSIDPNGNTTNTVTVGVEWVVDERGVPYSVPDSMAVTVEVTDIENATGRRVRPRRGDESGGGGSTSRPVSGERSSGSERVAD